MKNMKKKKQKKNKKPKKEKADSKIIKITSPINPDVVIPVLSERADDSIIEADITGKSETYYIYEFETKGKIVRGLSCKGVSEVVRFINTHTPKTHMRLVVDKSSLIKEEVIREGEKGIEVTVWVDDMISGQSYPGVKFEAYMKKGKNGIYPNTFSVEKATTKAIRNAFRRHFPEHLALKLIDKLSKNPNNIKRLSAAPEDIKSIDLEQTRIVELKPSNNQTKFDIARDGIMKLKTEFAVKAALEKAEKGIPGFDEKQNATIVNMLKTKLKMIKKK